MPGTGTRRQKAASPAGGEARSQSRRPRGKEARRTRGWEGRAFKTRLTEEKLLQERVVLQELPETSVSGSGAHSCQAGPSLHGAEVGTLGFHPHPHLSLRAPQTQAGVAPRQREGGSQPDPSERGLGGRLPASNTVSDKASGACGVSDLTSGAQLYVRCSFPRVPWVYVTCPAPRHVSCSTSRALAFYQAQSFRRVPWLHITCPAPRHVSGSTSRALAFSGAKAFRQVPCLSVTFPALCHVPCLSVTFPAVRHVPCFYISVWLCVSC